MLQYFTRESELLYRNKCFAHRDIIHMAINLDIFKVKQSLSATDKAVCQWLKLYQCCQPVSELCVRMALSPMHFLLNILSLFFNINSQFCLF